MVIIFNLLHHFIYFILPPPPSLLLSSKVKIIIQPLKQINDIMKYSLSYLWISISNIIGIIETIVAIVIIYLKELVFLDAPHVAVITDDYMSNITLFKNFKLSAFHHAIYLDKYMYLYLILYFNSDNLNFFYIFVRIQIFLTLDFLLLNIYLLIYLSKSRIFFVAKLISCWSFIQ